MRTLVALLLTTSTAYAGCNENMITMLSWNITPIDSDTNQLDTSFRLNSEKPIRMIDASAGFSDSLGGRIGSFAIERDLRAAPGEEFDQTGRWGRFTFERLLEMERADVVTSTCVRGVIYADGTKEEF